MLTGLAQLPGMVCGNGGGGRGKGGCGASVTEEDGVSGKGG